MNLKFRTLLLFLTALTVLNAQNNTSSPYSSRGFGEPEPFVNVFSRGMGNVVNGIRTARTVSLSNPASFAALHYVALDFGFRFDHSQLNQDNLKKTAYNGNFNNFSLAFPVYKKLIITDTSKGGKERDAGKLYREYKTVWSTGFGFMPFSNVQVAYSRISDTSYGQTGNYFTRRGGLNRLFLVNAVNLRPGLSIGLNTSFIFGQLRSNDAFYLFDSGVTRATFNEKNVNLSGFRFDFGVQGEFNADTIVRRDSVAEGGRMVFKTVRYPVRVVYGATVSNNTNLRFSEFRQVLNRSNYYATAPVDTIQVEDNRRGNTVLPLALSAGFSVTFNKLWMIAADYRTEMWSGMDKNLFSDSFGNSSQISIGLAYKPDVDIAFADRLKAKGKSAIEYRLGFRMLQTGYLFADRTGKINNLKEYGISFGISIPKTRVEYDVKTKVLLKSLFSLSGEYIYRGSNSNGMISENLYRLTLGFTFSDIWFKQRKFY